MGNQEEGRTYNFVEFGELELTPLAPDVRKSYVTQLANSKTAWDWVLKDILKAQIAHWTRHARTPEDLAFYRGGINMTDLLLETMESLLAEHRQNTEPPEEVDPKRPPLVSGTELEIL
jgi:hypothetical protein